MSTFFDEFTRLRPEMRAEFAKAADCLEGAGFDPGFVPAVLRKMSEDKDVEINMTMTFMDEYFRAKRIAAEDLFREIAKFQAGDAPRAD